MFRSTTIIRELETEPGLIYIDIKTFSKVTSLFVLRWCGSMSVINRVLFYNNNRIINNMKYTGEYVNK